MTPLLPDNAPFTPDQRAWLSGFFAALLGTDTLLDGVHTAALPLPVDAPTPAPRTVAAPAPAADAVVVTWHDPALPLETRMQHAAGLALPHRLYAAMGQQDCGQCGYLCESYARALFDGHESDTTLCTPGGRETRRRLKDLLGERDAPPSATAATVAPSPQVVAIPAGASRQHPLPARILENRPLHGPGAERDTRHVVIERPREFPPHRPGDALGVFPRNASVLIDHLLATLGLTADSLIDMDGAPALAGALLADRLDITRPSDACLTLLLGAATTASDRARLSAWLQDGPEDGVDLLDILAACPSARPDPGALLASLDRLQPRLYSIASCPVASPGRIELTVGVVRYTVDGRPRQGVASGCLADVLSTDTMLPLYLQSSTHFHLPEDPATPIVMVGPGTGIAPFRGFLQARSLVPVDRRGPAWLFFGNPHAACDFLYRDELDAWLADGTLTRLSTAFSRDQADRIYVQQRMREDGATLWQWLAEGGAHFYVCGDAKRMAADVEAALLAVAMDAGGLDANGARAWLAVLTADGRYRRDVY